MSVCLTWDGLDDILACPVCKGSLQIGGNLLQCQKCEKTYRIIEEIPHFIDQEDLDEFEQEESVFHSRIAEQADLAHGQATCRVEYLHRGFLEPILKLPPGSLILDVACGTGVDAIQLAEKGYRVVAVDIAPGMIRIAARKARVLGLAGRILFCVANAQQLPLHGSRFQAAYICAALHHVRHPDTVLSELGRVTQTGCIVTIGSEPNAWIYKFRSLKHSKAGRWLLRQLRDDYTVGEQPPGDAYATGWNAQDWPLLLQGTGLHLVETKPVWYLNGIASLFGLHSLPGWLESTMISIDNCLVRVPLVKYLSVKWNVITRKASGPIHGDT